MSYEKVIQAKNFIVGTKQTVKALKNGTVREVLIANDADSLITANVISVAQEMKVPITYVDSMKALGRACGIQVAASTVAITH